jgi:hypothetical protein
MICSPFTNSHSALMRKPKVAVLIESIFQTILVPAAQLNRALVRSFVCG